MKLKKQNKQCKNFNFLLIIILILVILSINNNKNDIVEINDTENKIVLKEVEKKEEIPEEVDRYAEPRKTWLSSS